MNHPMLIRSVTLSESSSEAWKAIGGWFPRRERSDLDALQLMVRNGYQESPILNLGNTAFTPTNEQMLESGVNPNLLFNHGDNIRPLVRPGTARKVLNDLMPAFPVDTEAEQHIWVKAPGAKGRGKYEKHVLKVPKVPTEWDIQEHVEGQEYRIITVDDKVIQGFRRADTEEGRAYEWVGVLEAPAKVKRAARNGARLLQGRNIIGWDIMWTKDTDAQGEPEAAYILEGNSCPGMSIPTAQRIMKYIEGNTYA